MTPKLYRQVSVSDRLPEKEGFYDTEHGLIWFNDKYFMTDANREPKYWYKQVELPSEEEIEKHIKDSGISAKSKIPAFFYNLGVRWVLDYVILKNK